ncbi:hypothetical protein [Pantoea stewartii]|uniref:hypothetical protein n=1 Tax=Pantoea stewartii TaxID=66269 RepID=UPI00345C46BE
MSETNEQAYLQTVMKLKAHVDVVFEQLKSGDYVSPDTFANNLQHLLSMAEEVQPYLKHPGLIERLAATDLMLTADLLGIVSSVAILGNFIACLSRQAGKQAADGLRSDFR